MGACVECGNRMWVFSCMCGIYVGTRLFPGDMWGVPDMTSYHVLFSKTWSGLESSDVLPGFETCNIAIYHVNI